MLPYVFSPFIFVRCPAYSFSDFESASNFKFLEDDFFLRAIYFASPDLFNQLKQKHFEPARLKPGARQSLLKYYNRMCYRSTPFGLFSSFSSSSWGNRNLRLSFTGAGEVYIDVDFSLAKTIASDLSGVRSLDPVYFNSSAYRVGKEIRYLKSLSADKAKAVYVISATVYSSILKDLWTLASHGADTQEIMDFFLQKFPEACPKEILSEFIDEELLHTSSLPNITGPGFLGRLRELEKGTEIGEILDALESLKTCPVKQLEPGSAGIRDLKGSSDIRTPFYVNYFQETEGSLCATYQHKLLDGIQCLQRLTDSNENSPLTKFRTSFFEKFENQEIPLMYALDPDVGVAYDGLVGRATDSELLADLNFGKRRATNKISWGELQGMLLNKISTVNGNGAIVLTDDDIAVLEPKPIAFSSGMSIMFRIYDQKVFIEAAGGSGATALIGRFTPFSNVALQQVREICKLEQEANPAVIFAEIAFCPEDHAANINVREHIWKYEIPVMVHSTLDKEHILRLDELMISVRGKELILRSSKLDKRIIPRLNSAYNHNRSELPVFRFLSDLQYQSNAGNLTFNFEKVIPGLTFYPRVEYRDCILSQAAWILKANDIRDLTDVNGFKVLAAERGFARYVALSEGDKQLVFDLDSDASIEMLLKELKGEDKIVFKEFFIPSGADASVKGYKDTTHISQFIACLTNPNPVYRGAGAINPGIKKKARVFLPGSNWFYLKIYCGDQIATDILVKKIYPFYDKNAQDIRKWFFIRYNDPCYHIRLRIQGDPAFLKDLPEKFNLMLSAPFKAGLISKIEIDTYNQEIERYGAHTIDQVEKVFQYSSEIVVKHLRKNRAPLSIIKMGLIGLDETLNGFNINLEDRIALLARSTQNLMNEHGGEEQLRADLNKKYRVLQSHVKETFEDYSEWQKKVFDSYRSELAKLRHLALRFNEVDTGQLAMDVLHMHMNRLFESEQRKNELVIHYLCLRYYLSQKARFKSTGRADEFSRNVGL